MSRRSRHNSTRRRKSRKNRSIRRHRGGSPPAADAAAPDAVAMTKEERIAAMKLKLARSQAKILPKIVPAKAAPVLGKITNKQRIEEYRKKQAAIKEAKKKAPKLKKNWMDEFGPADPEKDEVVYGFSRNQADDSPTNRAALLPKPQPTSYLTPKEKALIFYQMQQH